MSPAMMNNSPSIFVAFYKIFSVIYYSKSMSNSLFLEVLKLAFLFILQLEVRAHAVKLASYL